MTSRRDQFVAQSLFYEALSGEFRPPTDPLERVHCLSRLVLAVAVKGNIANDMSGHEYPEGRVYHPSWAQASVAELWLPEDSEPFSHQLILAEGYGRHPRSVSFTYESTRIGLPKDYIVVRDTRGKEEVAYWVPGLGEEMDVVQSGVAQKAQDFYNGLKSNP